MVFVPVESAVQTLEILKEQLLNDSKPVLIPGPPCSGKRTLFSQLTSRHHHHDPTNDTIRKVFKISLATACEDAKALVGTYGIRGGHFEWQAGPLIEAMRAGAWCLLDDLHLATPEVMAIIRPLLEAPSTIAHKSSHSAEDKNLHEAVGGAGIYAPGWGTFVKPRPGFRLFGIATTSSELNDEHDFVDDGLWKVIRVSPLCRSEQNAILASLYPQICKFMPWMEELSLKDSLRLAARLSDAGHPGPASNNLGISRRERAAFVRAYWDIRVESHQPFPIGAEEHAECLSRLLSSTPAEIHAILFEYPTRLLSFDDDGLAMTHSTQNVLRQVIQAVNLREHVLLVGHTGTGKTTLIQQLHHQTLHENHSTSSNASHVPQLFVVNMSLQSESSDLLGGWRPTSMQLLAKSLLENFFGASKMIAMLEEKFKNCGEWRESVKKLYEQGRWSPLLKSLRHATNAIPGKKDDKNFCSQLDEFEAAMRQPVLFTYHEGVLERAQREGHWLLLDEINLAPKETLNVLLPALRATKHTPADDDTLGGVQRGQCQHPSFRIFACMNPAVDVGKQALPANIQHAFTQIYMPEMNHADMLVYINQKLTVSLKNSSPLDYKTVAIWAERVRDLFFALKADASLIDANGMKPLLNLRSLHRALSYAASNISSNHHYESKSKPEHLQESFLEEVIGDGFEMVVGAALDDTSHKAFQEHLSQHLLSHCANNIIRKRSFQKWIKEPHHSDDEENGRRRFVVGPYKLPVKQQIDDDPIYYNPASAAHLTFTKTARDNLLRVSRAISYGKAPILLEGPTSAGKTTMVTWLAQQCNKRLLRINNHQDTDVSEYVGTWTIANSNGVQKDSLKNKSNLMVFKEGPLVDAMRHGHWLLLDELNLAPSPVLEALNRVLDDNRQLFITETGELVDAHPDFLLFATQNPAGSVYGGRKLLSRALRGRFLEIHIGEVKHPDEIEQILLGHNSCKPSSSHGDGGILQWFLAPSQAKRMTQAYCTLQDSHKALGVDVFAGRHALVTLRDLFKWLRRVQSVQATSAEEFVRCGQEVLAERLRHPGDACLVREILAKSFASPSITLQPSHDDRVDVGRMLMEKGVVPTRHALRLARLILGAVACGEAVLLVGETGVGKTALCQALFSSPSEQATATSGTLLTIVNCHQTTEVGDLLGSYRPIRHAPLNGVDGEETSMAGHGVPFEWVDGPLVKAMRLGHPILLDEISLAEDAVLERLNSVLEPPNPSSSGIKSLTLTEKSPLELIHSAPGFAVLATMNPGGDYGKKELSPALRNRFTEIWCPGAHDIQAEDIHMLITHKLIAGAEIDDVERRDGIVDVLVQFWGGWKDKFDRVQRQASLRDLMTVCDLFCALINSKNNQMEAAISVEMALWHAISSVFLDRLAMQEAKEQEGAGLLKEARQYLSHLLKDSMKMPDKVADGIPFDYQCSMELVDTESVFGILPFYLPKMRTNRDDGNGDDDNTGFSFDPPTTRKCLMKVARALQVPKRAVLLEGTPGIGKTALITALAKKINKPLTRINLSEHTDLSDLFGSDLPQPSPAMTGNDSSLPRPSNDDDSNVQEDAKSIRDAGMRFAWVDGPLLSAMRHGHWIILDELNLASQAVLEGLNACLDHRGEVYIPALDRIFSLSIRDNNDSLDDCGYQDGDRKGCRIFATQNPHVHGSGRKGLPRSFLSRFSCVWMEALGIADYNLIVKQGLLGNGLCGEQEAAAKADRMVSLVQRLNERLRRGAGWTQDEFNLRDLRRWLNLLKQQKTAATEEACILRTLFLARFPMGSTPFRAIQQALDDVPIKLPVDLMSSLLRFKIVPSQAIAAEAVLTAIAQDWLVVLEGHSGSGKTHLIHHLHRLHFHKHRPADETNGKGIVQGAMIVQLSMHGEIDTADLLGTYEQCSPQRRFIFALQDELTRRDDLSADDNADVADAGVGFLRECLEWLQEARTLPQLDGLSKLIRFKLANILSPSLSQVFAAADFSEKNKDLRTEMGFEWVDGPLVRAALLGHWLILDNADTCNPSVLDRLNGMFEEGGELTIPEQGTLAPDLLNGGVGSNGVRVVKRHPNFRVFLTTTSSATGRLEGGRKSGATGQALSKAMRNRALQVALSNECILGSVLDATCLHQSSRKNGLLEPSDPRQVVVAETNWHKLFDASVDDSAMLDASEKNQECNEGFQFWMEKRAHVLGKLRLQLSQSVGQGLQSLTAYLCGQRGIAEDGLNWPWQLAQSSFAQNLPAFLAYSTVNNDHLGLDGEDRKLVLARFTCARDTISHGDYSAAFQQLSWTWERVFGLGLLPDSTPPSLLQGLIQCVASGELHFWKTFLAPTQHNWQAFANVLKEACTACWCLNQKLARIDAAWWEKAALQALTHNATSCVHQQPEKHEEGCEWYTRNLGRFQSCLGMGPLAQVARAYQQVHGSPRFFHDGIDAGDDERLLREVLVACLRSVPLPLYHTRQALIKPTLLKAISSAQPLTVSNRGQQDASLATIQHVTIEWAVDPWQAAFLEAQASQAYAIFRGCLGTLRERLSWAVWSQPIHSSHSDAQKSVESTAHVANGGQQPLRCQRDCWPHLSRLLRQFHQVQNLQREDSRDQRRDMLRALRRALQHEDLLPYMDLVNPVLDALDTLLYVWTMSEEPLNPFKTMRGESLLPSALSVARAACLTNADDVGDDVRVGKALRVFVKAYASRQKNSQIVAPKPFEYKNGDEDNADVDLTEDFAGKSSASQDTLLAEKVWWWVSGTMTKALIMSEAMDLVHSDPIFNGKHDDKAVASREALAWIVRREDAVNDKAVDGKKWNPYLHPLDAKSLSDLSLACLDIRSLLQLLKEQFGEHDTLELAQEALLKLLSCDLSAPAMTTCQLCEVLLERVTKWNEASPQTLQIHADPLTQLILNIRRRELGAWRACLDWVDKQVQEHSLPETLCELSKLTKPNEDRSSRDGDALLLGNLDAFLLGGECRVGNFEGRLRLATLVLGSGHPGVRYYTHAVLPTIKTFLFEQKAQLQKELTGHLIAVRWTEATLWAVKESTRKSHRILRNAMRRYRQDMLAMPVSTIIAKHQPPNHIDYDGCDEVFGELSRQLLSIFPSDSHSQPSNGSQLVTNAERQRAFLDLLKWLRDAQGLKLKSTCHQQTLSLQLLLGMPSLNPQYPSPKSNDAQYPLLGSTCYETDVLIMRNIHRYALLNDKLAGNNNSGGGRGGLSMTPGQLEAIKTALEDLQQHVVKAAHRMQSEYLHVAPLLKLFARQDDHQMVFKVPQWSALNKASEQAYLAALKDYLLHANSKKDAKNEPPVQPARLHPVMSAQQLSLMDVARDVPIPQSQSSTSAPSLHIDGLLLAGALRLMANYRSGLDRKTLGWSVRRLQAIKEHISSNLLPAWNKLTDACHLHTQLIALMEGLVKQGGLVHHDPPTEEEAQQNKQNEKGKNGPEDQSGPTGMAEGERGDKDVSGQMDCEEQVTDVRQHQNDDQDKSDAQQQETGKDDDGGGDGESVPIDMREDFDAQLQELLDHQTDQDDDDGDDGDQQEGNEIDENQPAAPGQQNDTKKEEDGKEGEEREAKDQLEANQGQAHPLDSNEAEPEQLAQDGKDEAKGIEGDDFEWQSVSSRSRVDDEWELGSSDNRDEDDSFSDGGMNDVPDEWTPREDDEKGQKEDEDKSHHVTASDDAEDEDQGVAKDSTCDEAEASMDVEHEHKDNFDLNQNDLMSVDEEQQSADGNGQSTTVDDQRSKNYGGTGNGQPEDADDEALPTTAPPEDYSDEVKQGVKWSAQQDNNLKPKGNSSTVTAGQEFAAMRTTFNAEDSEPLKNGDQQPDQDMRQNNRPRVSAEDAVKKRRRLDKNDNNTVNNPEEHPESTQYTKSNVIDDGALAGQLAEHLRLILHPTIASRLRGDYKSGKRLNMRKILPFIASGYRRDRIWLRRTQPSKRDYHILLAMDNSQSMAGNGVGALALSSLQLMARALTRMEVGHVSVVSFGDGVQDVPLASDGTLLQSAPSALQEAHYFDFDAKSTDLLGLLDALPARFASHPGRGCPRLSNLCIIVSDGICDDHASLRNRLRILQSQHHITCLAIILDTKLSGQSITELNRMHFEYTTPGNNGENGEGKKSIVVSKYLATFPFEAWVIVKDLERLGECLVSALRTWFERNKSPDDY